ncbi:hypothetical protein ElyMa_003697900 [Elysia marginata]|uniref:Uncharacterized protein n=1 Tax=Elysia marginata TaxID=1093978 RepID=A0AAV4F243_9GAST|nr:hypothetical protein ElyMa_003697900 [Elysia marginata]
MAPSVFNRFLLVLAVVLFATTSYTALAQVLTRQAAFEAKPGIDLFYKALEEAHQLENFSSPQDSNLKPLASARKFLTRVNTRLRVLKHALAETTWDFQLDGSVENKEKLVNITEQFNEWYIHRQEEAMMYMYSNSLSEDEARQFRIFSLVDVIAKEKHTRR